MRIGTPVVSLLIFFASITNGFAAQDRPLQQKLAALEKITGKFTFAVIGDNRTGDDIYRKVIGQVLERKPAFIVNTGDQIEKPGNREMWANFWEMSKAVTVPYFFTVGNHDIHPEVAGSEETYKEQVNLPGNELYYSFVAGNSLFIVLDSYIRGEDKRITGEQYKWLEQVLAASKQKHKFVFVHHPLYPEPGKGKHHGNSLDRYKEERDRLQALFVKYKVTMVFLGHEHLYLRKTVDGIPHVIAGGGGAPLYAKDEDGGFHHYVLVTVDGDKVSGEVVDVSGKVRDRF
ncbi:MAG: metallophosphoesterase [Nitrospirota bacterium]